MKAREILQQLGQSEEIQNKIRSFKTERRHQRIVKSFECCGHCGSSLEHKTQANYLTYVVTEQASCTGCQQQGPKRFFTLN